MYTVVYFFPDTVYIRVGYTNITQMEVPVHVTMSRILSLVGKNANSMITKRLSADRR